VPYLSASEMVIHEEALYQVQFAPLPLPSVVTTWFQALVSAWATVQLVYTHERLSSLYFKEGLIRVSGVCRTETVWQ